MKIITRTIFIFILLFNLALAGYHPLKLELGGGANWLKADAKGSAYSIYIAAGYNITPKLSINFANGYTQLWTKNNSITADLFPYQLYARYHFREPYICSCLAPFIDVGAGFASTYTYIPADTTNISLLFAGLGFDIPVSNVFTINISSRYNITDSNVLDGKIASGKDGYIELRAGIGINISAIFSSPQESDIDDLYVPTEPEYDTESYLNKADSKTEESKEDHKDEEKREIAKDQSETDSLNHLREKLAKRRKNLANIKNKVEQQENDIADLKNMIGQKNNVIDSLQSSRAPSGHPGIQTRRPAEVQESESETDRPCISCGEGDVYTQYQNSLELFNREEYSQAARNFNHLYENHPNHRLAGNFLYWAGESYYGMDEYNTAIDYFNRIGNYSNSLKKDDALLMLGQCYYHLNQITKAKSKYRELLNKYPDSEYANIARYNINYLQ